MSEQTKKYPTRNRVAAGWRVTRRTAAVFVVMLMIAAPAGASVIVQNFMEAEIGATPACFYEHEGDDPANSGQASFSTDEVIAMDGVDLTEGKITLNGMTGDRVVYTDVVHYVNNCTQPVDFYLTAGTVGGDWENLGAQIWISNVADPAEIDPNLDPELNDDWQDTHIQICLLYTSDAADE